MWRNNRWFYQDETNGDPAGGGESAAGTEGKPAADAGGEPGAGGEAKPDGEAPDPKVDPMQAEIDKQLGYKPGVDGKGEPPVRGAPKGELPEAKAEREKKEAEAKAAKEIETKAAAGDPAAIAAKAEAEKKAKIEAAKPADLKALELTKEVRAQMKAETAQRYDKVLSVAKTERAAREAAEAKLTPALQARDAILDVLKQTNTTDDHLARLLEYNRLRQSTRPDDLQAALAVLDIDRGHLLKALGRKSDGYNPLDEPGNADLRKDVEDQAITEARALELAAQRKREALARVGETRTNQQRQTQEQRSQAIDNGQKEVDAWAAQVARTDIDFKAKEAILLPKIDEIVKKYRPE